MDFPRRTSLDFDADLLVHPDHVPEQAAERDHRSNSTDSADRVNSLTSHQSYTTNETDHHTPATLPPLQEKSIAQETDEFDALENEDEGSYDLVTPANPSSGPKRPSVESRSKQLFSHEHLKVIFEDPTLFRQFAGFLSTYRRKSVPVLIYYLDAVKSLKAIAYANQLAHNLNVVQHLDFTQTDPELVVHKSLQDKADAAFDALVKDDLPAYIAHIYIQIVSPSISKRIAGTLSPQLQEASEGLAEVFCLTDPSREDNPIVFASEEFNRTTQYGMNYIVGRNCRFLQGPDTNRTTVTRLKAAFEAGREISEVILNYRRDGTPFLNLLITAPLTDSRGRLRYFIGAQIDVSGLVKEGTPLDGLNQMLEKERAASNTTRLPVKPKKDAFESLCELFNHTELRTISNCGGKIYRDDPPVATTTTTTDTAAITASKQSARGIRLDDEAFAEDIEAGDEPRIPASGTSTKPRLLLREPSSDEDDLPHRLPASSTLTSNGRLSGVFTNYILVRPYPSLRILFTSPSLRVPGILQSPLMSRIGGSSRVRENLTSALAEGRGVTAKVKWVTRFDEDGGGRNRFLHFTPLVGANGAIGVWMVVMVDADGERRRDREREERPEAVVGSSGRRGKMAPVVMSDIPNRMSSKGDLRRRIHDRDERVAGTSTRASSRDGSQLSVRLA